MLRRRRPLPAVMKDGRTRDVYLDDLLMRKHKTTTLRCGVRGCGNPCAEWRLACKKHRDCQDRSGSALLAGFLKVDQKRWREHVLPVVRELASMKRGPGRPRKTPAPDEHAQLRADLRMALANIDRKLSAAYRAAKNGHASAIEQRLAILRRISADEIFAAILGAVLHARTDAKLSNGSRGFGANLAVDSRIALSAIGHGLVVLVVGLPSRTTHGLRRTLAKTVLALARPAIDTMASEWQRRAAKASGIELRPQPQLNEKFSPEAIKREVIRERGRARRLAKLEQPGAREELRERRRLQKAMQRAADPAGWYAKRRAEGRRAYHRKRLDSSWVAKERARDRARRRKPSRASIAAVLAGLAKLSQLAQQQKQTTEPTSSK